MKSIWINQAKRVVDLHSKVLLFHWDLSRYKQMQRVVRDRDASLLSALQQCTQSFVLYIYVILVITTESGLSSYFCIDVDLTSAFYCHSRLQYLLFIRGAYATTNDPGTKLSVLLSSSFIKNQDSSTVYNVFCTVRNSHF